MISKRLFDLVVAATLLLLLLPLLAVAALAVKVGGGAGPIFFRQLRPGLHGKPFLLIKFRTLRDLRDAQGDPLPDGERMTRLGRFLRASSLDELPELWNVVKGEMSLVGPRPLLMEYLPRYSAEQMRRHDLPPGLTGWAQVNGRNAQSWPERFALDLWYVDHRTFWLDLRILAMTLLCVVRRDGVNQKGHATMPKFTGNER